MIYYHVTPASNLETIMQQGLIPQVGPRSDKLNEQAGVFLFPTYEDCESALLNWLGEEFDELEEELITLQITLSPDFPLEKEVEWECISRQIIPPTAISFFKNEG